VSSFATRRYRCRAGAPFGVCHADAFPCNGFYWLASVATYSIPLVTALGMLSCALATSRTSSPAAIALSALGAAVLAFITAGGNESLILPLGVVLLAEQ